jgi:hypothetical protein
MTKHWLRGAALCVALVTNACLPPGPAPEPEPDEDVDASVAALVWSEGHLYFDAESCSGPCWSNHLDLHADKKSLYDVDLVAGARVEVDAFSWHYSGGGPRGPLPSFRIAREVSGALVTVASFTANGLYGTRFTFTAPVAGRYYVESAVTPLPMDEYGMRLHCRNGRCTPRTQPEQACTLGTGCDVGLQCASDRGYVTVLQRNGFCETWSILRGPDFGF